MLNNSLMKVLLWLWFCINLLFLKKIVLWNKKSTFGINLKTFYVWTACKMKTWRALYCQFITKFYGVLGYHLYWGKSLFQNYQQ